MPIDSMSPQGSVVAGRTFRIVGTAYMALVVVLIAAGIDVVGATIHPPWIWCLVVATLPLSAISALGTWALIHGADLGFFAAFYLACGVANVWAASRLLRAVRRRRRTSGVAPLDGQRP